jgi:thiamine biosynthesis lipoprotein
MPRIAAPIMNPLSRPETDSQPSAGAVPAGAVPTGAVHVRRHWLSMATRLDVELVGADPEHLEAVAAAIEDEVRRLDALLSRHDPTSEISRLNRRAAAEAVRVDADVWQLLCEAEHYRLATEGFFDITAASTIVSPAENNTPRLRLDATGQTVRFSSDRVAIDLGGIGKGFALDRAKQFLARYGVESALLSAGTSSILAVGTPAPGAAWMADVRHPADDGAEPIGRLALVDRSLSCSATVRPGQAISDIVDPHTGLPLSGGQAVVVLAPSGAQAEALSTALLAMGRRRATEYLARAASAKVDVAWIDGHPPTPNLQCPTLQSPNLQWLVRSHD